MSAIKGFPVLKACDAFAEKLIQSLYLQQKDRAEVPLSPLRLLSLDLAVHAEALLLSEGSQASIEFVSSVPPVLLNASLKKVLYTDRSLFLTPQKKNMHEKQPSHIPSDLSGN